MQRNYTISRLRRAFKVHQRLSLRQRHALAQRSKGQSGIAIDDDYQALRWQSHEFRMHKIEQWMSNDSINWFFARWLTAEEAKNRNGW